MEDSFYLISQDSGYKLCPMCVSAEGEDLGSHSPTQVLAQGCPGTETCRHPLCSADKTAPGEQVTSTGSGSTQRWWSTEVKNQGLEKPG